MLRADHYTFMWKGRRCKIIFSLLPFLRCDEATLLSPSAFSIAFRTQLESSVRSSTFSVIVTSYIAARSTTVRSAVRWRAFSPSVPPVITSLLPHSLAVQFIPYTKHLCISRIQDELNRFCLMLISLFRTILCDDLDSSIPDCLTECPTALS